MNLDKYKNEKNINIVFHVDSKTTTINQDNEILESLNYSSMKSAKDLAKDLGLRTITQLKMSKAVFNLDGSKRGYTAFREENK